MQTIPVLELAEKKFASLSFGAGDNPRVFNNYLEKYAPFEQITLDTLTEEGIHYLSHFDLVVIPFQGIKNSPRNQHGVKNDQVQFIRQLQEKNQHHYCSTRQCLCASIFLRVENVICTYEDNLITQQLVPQVIFGAIKAEGKLPITAGDSFKQGMGIQRA